MMHQQPVVYQQYVGLHAISIELPDLVHVCCRGEMTAQHVQGITAVAEAHLEQLAGSYMLVDLRQAAGMPGDARRLVVDWLRKHRLAATVNFGASTISRTFSNLAIRALNALHGQVVENIFVETEADARAWITRHRAHRKAR